MKAPISPIIYIPSRGRAGNILTPYTLPPVLREHVVLVVAEREVAAYGQAHKDLWIMGHPDSLPHIGAVRQWIMEQSHEDTVVMLDDDIRALHDKETGATRVRRLEGREAECGWQECFGRAVSYVANGIPMVGICNREGAWLTTEDYTSNGKLSGEALFIDRKVFLKAGARFDRVPVAEDLDATLQMLEQGHPNRRITAFSISRSKEGAAGGCSEYRTSNTLHAALLLLQQLHPGIVEVKDREPTPDRPMAFASHTKWKAAFGAALPKYQPTAQESLL